jgi:hypothetical protein
VSITFAAWESDGSWDDVGVKVRVLAAVSLTVAAGVCALLAGTALAAQPTLQQLLASLPAGWSHIDINVGSGRRAHTWTFDRGRVIAVSAGTLTLREPDGTIVPIPVAPGAVIRLNGRLAPFAQIRPGVNAVTRRVDGAPAIQVLVTGPPRLVAPVRPAGRSAGSGGTSGG